MESLQIAPYTALIVAFIAAAVSLVNIFTSKEQKVSELRQEWIKDLRNEVSDLIASVNSLSLIRVTLQSSNDKLEFLNETKSITKDIDSLSHRVRLRLNTKEHVEIIDTIEIIESQCGKIWDLEKVSKIEANLKTLHFLMQGVLKKEWERVKTGELGFRCLKMFFIFLIVLIVIYGASLVITLSN